MAHLAHAKHELRLAELMAALSLATDLANACPLEKTLRTCLLALRIGQRLGLTGQDLSDVYYCGLLRYIGCTSFAYEEAGYFGGDDIAFRGLYSHLDFVGQPEEVLRVTQEELAKDAEPTVRQQAMANLLGGGPELLAKTVAANCEVGIRLATRLGMSTGVRLALGATVLERWDGKGPGHLDGERIALPARIVNLAHVAETYHRLGGPGSALAAVQHRRGTQFDPAIADAFTGAALDLMGPLESASVWETVVEAEPEPRPWLPESRLDEVARAFADFADLKSPYTLAHSAGVARLAEDAGKRLGLSEIETVALRRAGLMHDLGRVSVPNGIWDKPGRLGSAEWERVRLHPYHTERILAHAQALASLSSLAGMHHERLDGSGYHRGIPAAMLATSARLLAAADVYQALTEERPHRPALAPRGAAAVVLAEATAGRLDREAVRYVLEAAGQPRQKPLEWPAGLTDREVEVLRLVVLGRSNKEVANELFLSHRTVQSHTIHIYGKLGVSSRSGAALFAMENDLLRR